MALGSALAMLLLWTASARADQVVCGAPEPEQALEDSHCVSPAGVAVDREAGVLYVADSGNGQVDAFDAEDGAFLDSFEAGVALSGIAVDNDPASLAFGDVYALDDTNTQVLKLHPTGGGSLEEVKAFGAFASQAKVAVGPGGVVYLADRTGGDCRLQQHDHEGSLLDTFELEACSSLRGLAVDSAGDFYAAFGGGAGIREYESDGDPFGGFHPSFNIQALGLDDEGNLFVSDGSGGTTATYLYDPSATLLKVLYGNGTQAGPAISLAPLSTAGGDLFLAEGSSSDSLNRVVQVSLPPPGPVVLPNGNAAEPSATKATLSAQVNPEGKESEFRFEYVEEAKFEESGFAEAQSSASNDVPEPESLPPFLAGLPLFAPSEVEAQIGCATPEDPPQAECLKPETAYRFRAVAKNAGSSPAERFGPVGSFETTPPLEVNATWSREVGIDAAKLSAEATAFGVPLSGRFQYVEESICLADLEALGPGHCFERAKESAELDFGAAEGPVVRTAQLSSLEQGTAYRYRVVLSNTFVPGEEAGETLTFTTFSLAFPDPCPNDALRGGAAAKLPDCRAYELVSPLGKGGGDIAVQPTQPHGFPAEANQSAAEVPASGPGLTYSADRAFADAISSPYTSQYIASRSPGDGDGDWEEGEGWQSHGISPPREGASFFGTAGLDTQFVAFTDDLRFGWLRTDSEPTVSADAIAGHPNLYRRDNPSDSYTAICPVAPPEASPSAYRPLVQGFSADGQRAIFRANDELTDDAASSTAAQLYACELGAAEPVLVSVLPGGAAHGGGAAAGTAGSPSAASGHREHSLHNAVSAAAERVYWTDSATGPGRIYLRERPFGEGAECSGAPAPCTVAVSEAVGGEGSDAPARFWTAARDGSAAIFSFTSGALAGNLYRFEAAGGEVPEPIAEGAEGLAGIEGLAGWSEDARRVYFTSRQALAAGAVEGQRNLYLGEAGEEARLVAAAVGSGLGFCSLDGPSPFLLDVRRCTRATPDGGQLTFMSRESLTGYDNKDAQSGEPAAEVFLYDAEAEGGAGQLLCVSCNPSGSRPVSRGIRVLGSPVPTAARLPAWQDSFHAPRALSADGRRLFFESYDSLLPADSNGALDVYQWERAGKGGCEAGDANHFPDNGGCIDLISSGQDRNDSTFLDASADGRDVFFKTDEGLWGPDPGLIDIYDARVGGGFPEPDPPRPPCEGEACQSPPAPPRQPAGASAFFAGPGDLAAPQPRCARAARKARRLSRGAKRLRRAAKRAKAPTRSRKLHRRAKGAAKRARRHSGQAKRCRRARARTARGARR